MRFIDSTIKYLVVFCGIGTSYMQLNFRFILTCRVNFSLVYVVVTLILGTGNQDQTFSHYIIVCEEMCVSTG